MRTYKLLSHIADIRMKVEADNLPELFVAAIEGMSHILKSNPPAGGQNSKVGRSIDIKSIDSTALIIDFMNEVLYQSQTNREIYTEVEFSEFSGTSLRAEISGYPVEEFDEDIKAVTYHEAEIVKNEKGNYETIIVFDI